jgi:hypothetical protein
LAASSYRRILAAAGAIIYAFSWLTVVAIRRVPMIGRRHRHRDPANSELIEPQATEGLRVTAGEVSCLRSETASETEDR